MYSYGKHNIDEEDIESCLSVLKSGMLTQGPLCNKFEDLLAEYFGSSYATVVSNGTAALHLAGLALGWKKGDIVLTTPMTFLATANCIIYSGAEPQFVDIDCETHNICPEKLEQKIISLKSNNKNVKAIIGVDYAGHPADWNAIRCIADNYKIQVVNDNCHALGSEIDNDKKYAIKYADVVTMSFHAVKHITTGEGGAVLTDNEVLDNKLQRLKIHGVTKKREEMTNYDGPWYYEMVDLGYNYRLTDFQCALGISQLKKLDMLVKRRREIASIYDQMFKKYNYVQIPSCRNNVRHSYHIYSLQVNFKEIKCDKNSLYKKLEKNGIRLQTHYIPIHLQPYYRKNYGYKEGDFPIAEDFYRNEITLPLYPQLSNIEVQDIGNKILSSLNL